MFSTVILFSIVLGVCVAYPLYDGIDCLLRNGAIGICRPVRKCPGGLKLIKQAYGTPSSHIRCGFEGNDEIICCPNTAPTPPDEDNNDSIYFDYTAWDRRGTTTTTKKPQKRPGDRMTRKPPVSIVNRISIKECEKYKEINKFAVTTHIIDGETVDQGEFPHVAALGYVIDDVLDFDCGGTLISDKYVVTAAHCIINNKRVRPSVVRMGTIKLTGNFDASDTDYKVQNIVIHPDYKKSSKYDDIALLELERPVKFSENILPACMYTSNDDPSFVLTIVGWGMTEAKRDSKSPVLLKANLNSLPRATCNSEYERNIGPSLIDGITSEQICAIDPARDNKDTRNKDTCQGDSGGPLQMLQDGIPTLVGITSFSIGECGSGTPGVYIRISKYLDWIESVVWPPGSQR